MTSPTLSIDTTKEIGRVYGLPHHQFGKKRTTAKTITGLSRNELFPSITNIIGVINPELAGYWQFMGRKGLEKGLHPWEALKEADRWLYATADRGTRVHAFIEAFIDSGYSAETPGDWKQLPEYKACAEAHATMEDLHYVDAFFNFIKDHQPRFITQESTGYGKTLTGLSYAGTTDFIAEIGGELIVGDWKTTSKLHDKVSMQLAAVMFAEKMVDVSTEDLTLQPMRRCDAAWGIQLKKDKSYAIGKVDSTPRAFELFSAAAELWALKVGIEGGLTTTEHNNQTTTY